MQHLNAKNVEFLAHTAIAIDVSCVSDVQQKKLIGEDDKCFPNFRLIFIGVNGGSWIKQLAALRAEMGKVT